MVFFSVGNGQDQSRPVKKNDHVQWTIVNFDHGHLTMVNSDHGNSTMVNSNHGHLSMVDFVYGRFRPWSISTMVN